MLSGECECDRVILEVTNYTEFPVPRAAVRAVARRAQRALRLPARTSAQVFFVNDRRMRSLNWRTRRVLHATDVLAFPLHALRVPASDLARRRDADGMIHLGDIVVSLPAARRQAAEQGVTLAGEVSELVAHGVLHLLGFDHVRTAERRRMGSLTRSLAVKRTS